MFSKSEEKLLFVVMCLSASLCVLCVLLGLIGRTSRNPVAEMIATPNAASSPAELVGRILSRTRLFRRFMSLDHLASDLQRSGWRFTAQEWLGLWLSTGTCSVLLAAFFSLRHPEALIVTIPLPLLGFALPKCALDQKVSTQKKLLEKQFTIFVEKMAICVAANVPILKILAHQSSASGPLSREVHLLLEEHGAGLPLEQALTRFANRIGTEAAQDFAVLVKNALHHGGTNLSTAMLAQTATIRRERELQMDATARKMETKILIPVVLTVLPAAAILLLGPLAVSIVRSLA